MKRRLWTATSCSSYRCCWHQPARRVCVTLTLRCCDCNVSPLYQCRQHRTRRTTYGVRLTRPCWSFVCCSYLPALLLVFVFACARGSAIEDIAPDWPFEERPGVRLVDPIKSVHNRRAPQRRTTGPRVPAANSCNPGHSTGAYDLNTRSE